MGRVVERGAHRLAFEVEAERAAGAVSMAEVIQSLNQRGVPSP